jgi:hypothetical protein
MNRSAVRARHPGNLYPSLNSRDPSTKMAQPLNRALRDALRAIRDIAAGIKALKYHPMKELHFLMELDAMEETLDWLSKETKDHGGIYSLEENNYEDLVQIAIEEGVWARSRSLRK